MLFYEGCYDKMNYFVHTSNYCWEHFESLCLRRCLGDNRLVSSFYLRCFITEGNIIENCVEFIKGGEYDRWGIFCAYVLILFGMSSFNHGMFMSIVSAVEAPRY